MRIISWLIGFLAVTISATAQGQGTIQQGGDIVTPGHVPVWVTNGVVGDGGSSADSPITSLGVTGQICSNSDRVTAAGLNSICFQAFTNSPAVISIQNIGTAPAESIQFNINGALQGFPTVSPLPTTVNDIACFTTTGGGLKDCGYAVSPLTIGVTTVNGATPTNILYNNSGVLGQYTITGSGNVVMSASPTFTGTPVLSTPTATSLALGGATIGSNTLAVTGASLFNSATTFGAAVTYGGVTLNNAVTGSGNMVLSASPTLTGTVLSTGIAGGSAAGSTLTLESTSSVSPSGDSTTINGSTITISAVSGASTINLGLANASGANINVAGGSSGSQLWKTALAASGTITWPAGTIDFSASGGSSQVVKQTSAGGSFTVGRLACADLSNAVASCSTDATNASNISSGTLGVARLPVEPNFRVHLVGNQSISASTYTKVLYDTVDIDSNSFWSATNHNYLPTISGTYQFCASGYVGATYSLGSLIIIQFSKNGLHGTGTEQGSGVTLTGGANTFEGVTAACTIATMNGSTDTMEVDIDTNGTSPTITGFTTASVVSNYFTGTRISP